MLHVHVRQLHAFLEIARLQSFTRAAERVHLSQAGISMLVKELEGQVGAKLFERTTRSVTLTEAGRLLEPVAARVVRELAHVGDAIGGVQQRALSQLHVAATPMVSACLLPGVQQAFAASHPQVAVQLADVALEEVRRRVLEGESDIGLGFFFKASAGMTRSALCRFRLMLVGPLQGRRRGLAKPRRWDSLQGVPLIGLPPGNPIQQLIESHLQRVGRGHEQRPVMNFIGTAIAMAEAGIGHVIVPSFVLPSCLRHDVVVEPLAAPEVHLDLMLIARRGAAANEPARDFAQALAAAARRLPS